MCSECKPNGNLFFFCNRKQSVSNFSKSIYLRLNLFGVVLIKDSVLWHFLLELQAIVPIIFSLQKVSSQLIFVFFILSNAKGTEDRKQSVPHFFKLIYLRFQSFYRMQTIVSEFWSLYAMCVIQNKTIILQ